MEERIRKARENEYFKNKEQLDDIRSDITLLKWEILSRANKQGKELWGKEFTAIKLSNDMGVPLTTVKRCLALDKASPKTWELIRQKKISAFKAAMVCQLKSNVFQDEIMAVVLRDNLSTYQIKSFKPNSIKDVNKWRHEKAVEKGYSRQDVAFKNFNNWIQRGSIFLLMPISSVGWKKKAKVIEELRLLKIKIEKYLLKNG
jgi:hypothetical protein